MKNDKKNYSRRNFIVTSAKGAAIISAAGIINPYSLYAGPHALVWARTGYRDGGILV